MSNTPESYGRPLRLVVGQHGCPSKRGFVVLDRCETRPPAANVDSYPGRYGFWAPRPEKRLEVALDKGPVERQKGPPIQIVGCAEPTGQPAYPATGIQDKVDSQIVLLKLDALGDTAPDAFTRCNTGRGGACALFGSDEGVQVGVAGDNVGRDEARLGPCQRLGNGPETDAGTNLGGTGSAQTHGVWEMERGGLGFSQTRRDTHIQDGRWGPVLDVDKGVVAAGDVPHGLVQAGLEVEHVALPSDAVDGPDLATVAVDPGALAAR